MPALAKAQLSTEPRHVHLPIFGPIASFGWLALIAFMRRFCTAAGPPVGVEQGPGAPGPPCPGVTACPGNRGGLGCSTGSTRRLFLGSLALACVCE